MNRTSMRVLAAAVAVSTVLVAGEGSAAAQSRPAVPVHSTTQHPVTAPDHLQPGLVHLRNTGGHELFLFRKLRLGPKTLVTDLNNSDTLEQVRRLYRQFRLVTLIDGSSDVVVRLTDGTYYLADATAEHFHAGDIHVLTVAGTRKDARVPHAKTVNVSRTNILSAPAAVRGGAFVRVRNADDRLQNLLYVRVSNSTTDQQLRDFLAAPTFEKLFGLGMLDLGTIDVLAGHQVAYVRFPAHSGRYVVITSPLTSSGVTLTRARVKLVTAH